ncbi:MAG: Asp-tRNA(Asn)/Glu-tRNA(Gln) amidotransferase GatCAB subunit B, partial [Saprospiraceae bacterium]|nr:Asp-tRNA(Asn)/Glu-tRNA(Gln) amidotransferase GatCAB subunit B [Saprospiraceae bacterium]
MVQYQTVVGLEVHIQMNTYSKAFCGDALSFGAEPNTHVSTISLAHPGTLPKPNKEHINKGLKLALSLNSEVNKVNAFDRKHYYYADSPKAYQITQDRLPICVGGALEIELADGSKKNVRIHHMHMEEDAGKTIHDIDTQYSMVDLNRAGTPLLELVTEPDLNSGDEVLAFIAQLQQLVRYL